MNASTPIPLRPDPAALARRNVSAVVRACITKAIATFEGHRDELAILKGRWPDDTIAPLVLRAASPPATLAGTPALAASIVADVIATIGPTGAGARLLQSGLQLVFDRYATIRVPAIEASANQVAFVGEGQPIPVHDLLTQSATLTPRKIAVVTALSREMVESSNAEMLVSAALIRSVGLALDAALFDSAPADAVRPAGLRHGISALVASSTANADDAMIADLTAISGVVAQIGEPFIFIANPARAVTIQLRARREFPYAVFGSPALAANDVIAVAGVGLASAVAAMPEIEASKVATLHEEDAGPLPIADDSGVVAAPTRALMQTDAIGLRLRFLADWVLRDPRALAWTTATGW